ncbi:MAG: Mfa1 family fimbria major subunit [Prevotellaceae bacterium]|nr:Mfa1 family fimbria major subunit [Prevotellaceae bacterium]
MNTRKIFKMVLPALVGLALAACTDNDTPVDGQTVTGDGYASFSIHLPTRTTTRAANDNYADGTAQEYHVNDATLLLFSGTGEEDAVCYAIYDCSYVKQEAASENITTQSQFTRQISRPVGIGRRLYVLVVLNKAGVLEYSGSGLGASGTFGGRNVMGATLKELQTSAAALDVNTIASLAGDGNFYMTNAPLYTAKGGFKEPYGEVKTLAYIDSGKIYDTEEEAKANPATNIYVERGVAKVTVSQDKAYSTNVGAVMKGFLLDLTNTTAFPVRNSRGDDAWWRYASGDAGVNAPYRFVGNVEVDADRYRTYWATDPNYDQAPYEVQEGVKRYPYMAYSGGTVPEQSELAAIDGTTPRYCLENTFNTAHQYQDETTRVVVAAVLQVENADEDGTFYTLDGDKSTPYDKAGLMEEAVAYFAAVGSVQEAERLWQGGAGDDLFSHYEATIDGTVGSADATVSLAYKTNMELLGNQFTGGVVPAVLDPSTEEFAQAVAAINAAHEFTCYAGGMAYYPVMLKHFGDELTPWDMTEVADAIEHGDSYPDSFNGKDAEQNWLGRYGVLRNNWYDITVHSINSIGSAVIPEVHHEPDDPRDSWISVEINILSWAKRTQGVIL